MITETKETQISKIYIELEIKLKALEEKPLTQQI